MIPGRPRRAAMAAAVVAGALGAFAITGCAGPGRPRAIPPTSDPAPNALVAPPTTGAPTTTVPPATSPLTGLPQTDPSALHRPALVVKIDNIDAAIPQSGLAAADVVYEEMVEGGLTRLAAVYQSTDASLVGPVRSGRTTDIAIVSDLGRPVFAFSGANPPFLAEIRAADLVDVDAELDGPAKSYFRMGPHDAPDNLYSSTQSLYSLAPTPAGADRAPGPLFTYRPGGSLAAVGAIPATHAALAWPATSVSWDWNAGAGNWQRSQGGRPDLQSNGYQLQAPNIVIQFVTYTTDGVATGEGVAPTPIPKGELVGSGPAWVLSGDSLVKGSWSRPSLADVTSYTDTAGRPIAMAPGRTWVELAPAGSTPLVS
ncbi:MAG: DUF3048 domain-containing protein [Acidimicrobiales bacterium]